MSTRPDPEGIRCGGDNHPGESSSAGSVGLAQAHPLKKSRLCLLPAGPGPVPAHPTRWGVGLQSFAAHLVLSLWLVFPSTDQLRLPTTGLSHIASFLPYLSRREGDAYPRRGWAPSQLHALFRGELLEVRVRAALAVVNLFDCIAPSCTS